MQSTPKYFRGFETPLRVATQRSRARHAEQAHIASDKSLTGKIELHDVEYQGETNMRKMLIIKCHHVFPLPQDLERKERK